MKLQSLALFGLVLAGCGGEPEETPAPRPRPVRVIELREMDPIQPLQLTGAVTAWSEEDVAFEVDGRVTWIVESGTNLEGRWEQDGTIFVEGDVLARLNTEPYEIQLAQARAAVSAAENQLNVAQVELDQVLPASVASAKANRDRAEAEFDRNEEARGKNAISELDLIRARADRDAGRAEYDKTRASLEAKKAEIEALKTNVDLKEEDLRAAEYDVERCTLFAPFQGEVSAVHVETGGFASRSQSVAHLVMMDPSLVEVAVAAETAKRLNRGQTVRVYLPDGGEPVFGSVYEVATVADPDTRTFTVKIVMRNLRGVAGIPAGDPRLDRPRIDNFMYLERADPGDTNSPYFVEEQRALRFDDDGRAHVWAAPEYIKGTSEDPSGKVVELRRIDVIPGEMRRNLQGLYLMRELANVGKLADGVLLALDIPDDFEDGDQALIARDRWLVRPGMLLPVVLDVAPPVPGIYAPLNALRPLSGERAEVFVADAGLAKKVTVRVLDTTGELARIESESPGELAVGAKLIVDHVHFLQPGEPVRVVRMIELTP